ncbi:helix-turn-helix domain-containing protein [Sinorhizobium terangae]|uniref:Chromosomal replication initiator DnaA n=1 Tax=Sinorhizobium terangae TaxID=110322 RepID=A0A6N7LRZ9_SINTE|nr:helix-turn-helix domain-containing protein [Sinorhizobium terangae]MBB4189325.1 chromosomal replication initiator protein [Sinorhizobium terangae]MQX18989.1 chromosomal replication initiator DnaA [Sinorhizobium terangae]MQX19004.1 chromosomal replication initiator DnaA [Sinorhizobium terangae]WFU49556.1 helix-turn-helix domain-containing protein [Sinorhizobium terangae]
MTNPSEETQSQLARLSKHYGAVRERLVRPTNAVVSAAAAAELERRVQALASDNAAKARRIAALETELADAGARLIAQAQVLLGQRAGEEAEDGDRPPVEEIVAAVLERFPGVSWEDIISVRRERRLVEPRHACMRAVYDARKDLSLPLIGRIFRRNHVTVLGVVQRRSAEA